MYNTKTALLLEAIKVLDVENVHYSLPTMKSRDDSAGGCKCLRCTWTCTVSMNL